METGGLIYKIKVYTSPTFNRRPQSPDTSNEMVHLHVYILGLFSQWMMHSCLFFVSMKVVVSLFGFNTHFVNQASYIESF